MSDIVVCGRHGLSARMTAMDVHGKCPVCQGKEIARLKEVVENVAANRSTREVMVEKARAALAPRPGGKGE